MLDELLLRFKRSAELMAIRCLEAFLILLSGKFIVLLDFQPNHTIDQLRVSFIDQNFKDWITVQRAL